MNQLDKNINSGREAFEALSGMQEWQKAKEATEATKAISAEMDQTIKENLIGYKFDLKKNQQLIEATLTQYQKDYVGKVQEYENDPKKYEHNYKTDAQKADKYKEINEEWRKTVQEGIDMRIETRNDINKLLFNLKFPEIIAPQQILYAQKNNGVGILDAKNEFSGIPPVLSTQGSADGSR